MKLKPGLAAFYDIHPGNWADLYYRCKPTTQLRHHDNRPGVWNV